MPEKNASIVCNEQIQSALEGAVEQVRHEAMLVLKNVNGGLDTWTKLGADLGETRKHLDQLAVRLETMAAGVEAGKGTVGKLITDTALGDEAQKLLARANEAMGELQGVVTNLNIAVKNIQAGTVRLPEITDAVANETKDLAGFVQQTHTSMREIERLVEAMQRHWFLRKYVNPTNPPSRHPLSESARPEQKPVKIFRSPRDSTR